MVTHRQDCILLLYVVTKWSRKHTDIETVWQRNYHENIIRNEQSYQTISKYIINNPFNWKADKFYYKWTKRLKNLKLRKALHKAFLKVKTNRGEIGNFNTNLIQLLDRTNFKRSEEFHKNLVIDFTKFLKLNDLLY